MTIPSGDERTRAAELERVRQQLSTRLDSLGVRIDGSESAEELVELLERVQEFEAAVESAGGDLMVDEGMRGKATEPDDQQFALPTRLDDEALTVFRKRLVKATAAVRHLRA